MENDGNKKQKKWVIAIVVIAAVAIAAYLAYRKIYSMLFEGKVAASVDDVYATIKQLTVPIVCSVAVIIAAIVVWIIVSKKEKAVRSLIRWQSVVSVILVITVAINWSCLYKEYSLINKVLSGTDGLSEETKKTSEELGKQISEESIVLLKNEEGALPLSSDKKINVFGWGSTQANYGGTGSGSVDTTTATTFLQGLQNAGFETNTELTDFYTDFQAERSGGDGMGAPDWTVPQPTIDEYDAANVFEQAKEFSDTALIVITRAGGEGADLPDVYSSDCSYNLGQHGEEVVFSTQEDDIDSNKSYLELTNREVDMVKRVTEEFDNVIAVVNSSNAMELGWLDEYENINAAVWIAGAGATGFDALGSVLSGEVNPSGRLVDTYVYDLSATPAANNFGEFSYENGTEISGSEEYTVRFVNYVEGIYVGYKFYETAAAEGSIDYESVVQYPFGYGLSYTEFDKQITDFVTDGKTVNMKVEVTNTGDTAGKDVAEIYYTPPYYNGGIEKASTNLVEFAKTDLLEPGESQTLEISFDYEDMAAYDDTTNKSYVLEHGDYEITLNNDAHTVVDSETLTLDEDVIYNDENDGKRDSDEIAATNQFDYAKGDVTYLSRKDHFANYEEATAAPVNYTMSDEDIENFHCKNNFNADDYDDSNAEMPVTGADNGLTINDVVGLDYDDSTWDDLIDQLTVDEMAQLVTDGASTVALKSVGNSESTEIDGPAGLSTMFNDEQQGTAFPPATAIAATWNKELAKERGVQIGVEAKELGVTGWYGPAMNTHRSAFSGRNFEYYSEDGVLSGLIAAEEVSGATSQGVICYMKHFAMNDQETNRTNGICTWSTEQAIREIYLKPFEYAVKEGGTFGIMTSFNHIGYKWAGSNEDLLQTVLRGEWGFHGAVDTDAMDPSADFYMDINRGIRTGLGKAMSFVADTSILHDTDKPGTVIALKEQAHEILYAIANSNAMDKDTGMPGWVKTFIVVDVLIGLGIVLAELYAVMSYKKKRKEAE